VGSLQIKNPFVLSGLITCCWLNKGLSKPLGRGGGRRKSQCTL